MLSYNVLQLPQNFFGLMLSHKCEPPVVTVVVCVAGAWV